MSFTRLLATSRSLMGIKKQPGPYKLNQEHLLPRFEPVAKVNGAAVASEADGTERTAAVETQTALGSADGQDGAALPNRPRGVLASLAAGLVRLRHRGSANSVVKRPVQAELDFPGLKVVRNDLSDCNFPVVLGTESARVNGGENPPAAQRQGLGMVWNRLSARLLRQAAQEFTSVQKERGKLCSQAGNGRPGPRGA
jgi:hypothetical protein